MTKKYYLETLSVGCPKNMLESSTYRKILGDAGFELTDEKSSADVVVFNTCGCLETFHDMAKNAVATTNVESHENVIVAGCYPFIDKENNLKEQNCKIVAPGDYDQFQRTLGLVTKDISTDSEFNSSDYAVQPSFVSLPSKIFSKISSNRFISLKVKRLFKSLMMTTDYSYVTVGSGCSGKCTFCGIKNAIGNPKSESLGKIIKDFSQLLDEGKKDIWLSSDDVGSWGTDIGSHPDVLLKNLLNDHRHFNLVVNYFEPEMYLKRKNQLIHLFKDKRLEQLCIPLQTGSQALLKRMGRHYDINEVCSEIKKIRRENPNVILKSQYIVGFPGETWSDFLKTIWSFRFYDGVGVNAYARLKFTAAYNLKPLSPVIVKVRTVIAKLVSYTLFLRIFPEVVTSFFRRSHG